MTGFKKMAGRVGAVAVASSALLMPADAIAQLTVDNAMSPQQLVEDVLIGQGVEVSNIQFTGHPEARGSFSGTASNIGLASGVILSTGRVADAPGPNGTPLSDFGTNHNRPGDPVLTSLSGTTNTFDAAILEFDFVPSSDTVRFRYVFASNEYMTYVGGGVNDVFAFLISGPGIVGEQNIALLPGTTTPVTIDNVNANVNSQYYIDNGGIPGSVPGQTVEYNGFTTVLTASAVLTPCQTYHIRLAIADAGDGLYDSAVFLDAGSFTSPTISMGSEVNFSDTENGLTLVEACSQLTLTFERSAPFDNDLTVNMDLSGTAIPGTDYTGIGPTITFPAGQGSVTINVQIPDNGTADGPRTAVISIVNPNPCATGPPQSVSFTIIDRSPLSVLMSPAASYFCPQDHTIIATPQGGHGIYSYAWTNLPGNGPEQTVSPLVTTNYSVTVTDQCGQSALGTSNITMQGYVPIGVRVEDAVVCNGEETEMAAVVSGGAGSISYAWSNGQNAPAFQFAPSSDEMLYLTVTDSCGFSASDSAQVKVDNFTASFYHEHLRNDTYQYFNTSQGSVWQQWDLGEGTVSNERNPRVVYPEPNTYTVTLTARNANGCESDTSAQFTTYPEMRVYVPNSFSPNGDGLNDTFGLQGEGFLGYSIRIFYRGGQEVHKGAYVDESAWDGMLNGSLVPRGTYPYRITVRPYAGMDLILEGTVTPILD